MQLRPILILLVAIILGGVTVYLVNQFLQREVTSRTGERTVRTVPVVVAAADLNSGTRLDGVLLEVVAWPEASLPEGTFSSKTALLQDKPPLILTQAKKGEPILKYKLSPYGARGGLPAKIPEDKRAITLAVNEVKGVGGFVMPGDYVDVLHTTTFGRSDEKPVTRVILQNAKVLGIDQQSSDTETEPKVVNSATIMVTPYDGQRIVLAAKTGDLNLMLRNEFDASILESEVVTYKDLMTEDTAPTKVKVVRRVRRAPPKPQVEVIRGLEVKSQTVKEGQVQE
ncbi:Flp pilus assembly protein CpaB [Alcanivorax sediminis]|uniref:Flp pilus assembly protein CpaB n=1 Tax=Alcanivorax sediminis TaxID=2663008 RepID=A0A6N7LUD5_9GAMM|nr:Flp pilus assembly protein CpaB [Alcanivorax sediminis]MQX52976.1 Flp pilus assembly protein CpaB [Alcanivorax sediminis]